MEEESMLSFLNRTVSVRVYQEIMDNTVEYNGPVTASEILQTPFNKLGGLGGLFIWDRTPQKHNYWGLIDADLQKKYKEEKEMAVAKKKKVNLDGFKIFEEGNKEDGNNLRAYGNLLKRFVPEAYEEIKNAIIKKHGTGTDIIVFRKHFTDSIVKNYSRQSDCPNVNLIDLQNTLNKRFEGLVINDNAFNWLDS